MAHFLLRKLLMLLATLLSVSLIVFLALELNIEDVAINVLGPYSAADQRAAWLLEHGYNQPFCGATWCGSRTSSAAIGAPRCTSASRCSSCCCPTCGKP